MAGSPLTEGVKAPVVAPTPTPSLVVKFTFPAAAKTAAAAAVPGFAKTVSVAVHVLDETTHRAVVPPVTAQRPNGASTLEVPVFDVPGGTYEVYAQCFDDQGTTTGDSRVPNTVVNGQQVSVPVTSTKLALFLELAPDLAEVQIGKTQQFTATLLYEDDSRADVTPLVNWKIEDATPKTAAASTVASIDATGLATGLAVGTANVIGEMAGGAVNAVTLNVTAVPVPSPSPSPSPLPTPFVQETIPAGVEVVTLDFADATHGIALGNAILTYDGTSWTRQADVLQYWFGVSVADATHAFGVGYSQSIFATGNAGANWIGNNVNGPDILTAVTSVDATHAWVAGNNRPLGDNDPAPSVWRTTNGGSTWTRYDIASMKSNNYGGAKAVCFVDANKGWVVGSHGQIFVTTNGRTTWTAQTSGSTEWFSAVKFVDATHGWVVGSGGAILKTADGGTTWTAQSSGTTSQLTAVSFYDATHGIVVGQHDTILKTADGGMTWTPLSSGFTSSADPWPKSVKYLDATHAWIVVDSSILRLIP